ncbi:hypothetical protein SD37_14315 [Amycolatopsis orientalis]|uniref:Aminoglycoside phosphotransferase domain-containing protein n=1 Tax=Amycolatopsis orientalis TaxID=31958 RepID=A0A193BWV5_AMYOR|nr:hypothetical protein [Amycolatopsis orientalis]ANN16716.1 hypothetical protein SD37_14315 [Amycolatopsis orientalis]
MKKYRWGELPEAVREGIRERVGAIAECEEVEAGQSSNFTAVVHRDGAAPLFVKGVEGISPPMRWLRNEAGVGELTSGIAPAVHFSADIEDWLVVGFEYVRGRRAQLAPGSSDLALVATALDRIGRLQAPGLRALEQRWQPTWWDRLGQERPEVVGRWNLDELVAWERKVPALVAGNSLLHTDLHPDQFLIADDGEIRVIDWGWPARGAAWVDPAFLVIRLIDAGHPADEAETWARQNTRWAEAGDEAITAFAVYVAGLWSYKAATTARLARIARDYLGRRLPARE